jgi:hypothetical protein
MKRRRKRWIAAGSWIAAAGVLWGCSDTGTSTTGYVAAIRGDKVCLIPGGPERPRQCFDVRDQTEIASTIGVGDFVELVSDEGVVTRVSPIEPPTD